MRRSTDRFGAAILIVDDQEANVRLIEHTLRRGGYVGATSTTNSLEVRALHRRNRYDLIILDLQMPLLDGFGVLAALRELEEQDRPAMLVMSADPSQLLPSLEAGATSFLSKPFHLQDLLLQVRGLLEPTALPEVVPVDSRGIGARRGPTTESEEVSMLRHSLIPVLLLLAFISCRSEEPRDTAVTSTTTRTETVATTDTVATAIPTATVTNTVVTTTAASVTPAAKRAVAATKPAPADVTSATTPAEAPATGRKLPKTHTVDHGGVMHAPGADNATQKCAGCHGKDLRGGKVAKASCFECHEKTWK